MIIKNNIIKYKNFLSILLIIPHSSLPPKELPPEANKKKTLYQTHVFYNIKFNIYSQYKLTKRKQRKKNDKYIITLLMMYCNFIIF